MRRWLYTPIIIWQGDWILREYVYKRNINWDKLVKNKRYLPQLKGMQQIRHNKWVTRRAYLQLINSSSIWIDTNEVKYNSKRNWFPFFIGNASSFMLTFPFLRNAMCFTTSDQPLPAILDHLGMHQSLPSLVIQWTMLGNAFMSPPPLVNGLYIHEYTWYVNAPLATC